MWPYKEGLGVILSYGVNGNGMVTVKPLQHHAKSNLRLQVDFPRIRNEGITLNEVSESQECLVKSQVPLFSINSRMYNDFEVSVTSSEPQKKMYHDSKMYIPRDILKSYLVESRSLTSTIAYDPAYSNLCPISEIKSRNGQTQCKVISFVTGESGNILNISGLNYERKEIKDQEHESIDALVPKLDPPFQIALSEPIKQIEFCKKIFDYIPSILIIRTSFKIYVLKCFRSVHISPFSKSKIELDIIGELQASDLLGFEFADVTFNPWDYTQFACVDVKGNFGIWNIRKDNVKTLKKMELNISNSAEEQNEHICKPSVYDVSELSNWKKITWTNDTNTIMVLTRSSVTQFTLMPKLSSLKLITSNTWSRIQDYYKSGDHAFLLTSKEIIWFRLTNPVSRLISWKHFLDDSDPSLKLHVSEFDSGCRFICLIYSQMHPLIFVYNFGIKEDKPYSLRDPYYIRKGGKNGNLQQIFLHELNRQLYRPSTEIIEDQDLVSDSDSESNLSCKVYGLFELNTDLGLLTSLLTEEKGLSFRKLSFVEENCQDSFVLIKNKSNFFSKFKKNQFEIIFDNLLDSPNQVGNDEEAIKIIQDYAFKLGEGALRINNQMEQFIKAEINSTEEEPSCVSLIDISKDIPASINDVSEFDSMIEQLAKFYEEKEIHLTSLINHSLVKNCDMFGTDTLEPSTDKIQQIHSILEKFYFKQDTIRKYNKASSLKKVSILMGASLIKAKSMDLSKYSNEKYEMALESAPDHIKSILDSWDEELTLENTDQGNMYESQRSIHDITSSMPAINLTQDRPFSNKQKSRKSKHRDLRHTALTQNSQAHSQSQRIDDFTSSPFSSQAKLPILDSQIKTDSENTLSSQEGSSSSQFIPSSLGNLVPSQKRFISSQPSASQRKLKKKKKSGFA